MNNIPGSGRYNSFVFIPGDFTASWNHFYQLYREYNLHISYGGGRGPRGQPGQFTPFVEVTNPLYDFISLNCVHAVMNGLNLGILNNSLSVNDFLTAAGSSTNLAPDIQLARLQYAFGNTALTQVGAIIELDRSIRQLDFAIGIPLVGGLYSTELERQQGIRALFD
jgi:hypothetical protein